MVVKMKKWSPWQHQPPVVTGSKKFRVKVERIKLEGFEHGGGGGEKVMGVELRWKGERKHGLAAVGFHRRRPGERWCKERIVRKGEVIVWEEEDDLENICWFSTVASNAFDLNQHKFAPWIVTFKFTYVSSIPMELQVLFIANLLQLYNSMMDDCRENTTKEKRRWSEKFHWIWLN